MTPETIDHLKWVIGGIGAVLLFSFAILGKVIGGLVQGMIATVRDWVTRLDKKLDDIDSKLDEYAEAHAACQRDLGDRFADKRQTGTDIRDLYEKTNANTMDVKRLDEKTQVNTKEIEALKVKVDNEIVRRMTS